MAPHCTNVGYPPDERRSHLVAVADPALPANLRRDSSEHYLRPSGEGGLCGPDVNGPRLVVVRHRSGHGCLTFGDFQWPSTPARLKIPPQPFISSGSESRQGICQGA